MRTEEKVSAMPRKNALKAIPDRERGWSGKKLAS